MAKILHIPDQHRCLDELEQLQQLVGKLPVGTIAECSCELRYIVREHQFDGPYWYKMTGETV